MAWSALVIDDDGTHDLMELRTLNDWVIMPRMLRTPSVGDTANFGGFVKQYQVILNPKQLERFGIALGDVVGAVGANNSSGGGSMIRRGAESFAIRGVGSLTDEADIARVFIKTVDGTPVYVRDVASVALGYPQPSGIWSKDRTDQSVEGIVVLRKGENPSEVLTRIEAAVQDLNDNVLPKGVHIEPYYNRAALISNTLETVFHSVLIGITLVVLVLLIFMGSPKMALMVALTIPFALLFALVLMYFTNIPIGLLSVGAIDFGIIVDAAVIIADQIAHRLGQVPEPATPKAVRRAILTAVAEVEHPVLFAMLIIIATYIPLLTLTQIEVLLFRPMAITLVFALLGALLFSLVGVPVLATLFFRRGLWDWENPLGGTPVTTLYEGERQFNVVVKFAEKYMRSPQAIGRLPVFTADGTPVPLEQVANIELRDGQTLIAREDNKRRMTVRCDIVGRDLPASLATGVGSDVQRPLATVIVWGLVSASTLTLFVVPILYRIMSPGIPKPATDDDDDDALLRPQLEAEAPGAGTGDGRLRPVHSRGIAAV